MNHFNEMTFDILSLASCCQAAGPRARPQTVCQGCEGAEALTGILLIALKFFSDFSSSLMNKACEKRLDFFFEQGFIAYDEVSTYLSVF